MGVYTAGAFHLNSTRVATHILRIDSLFYQLMGLMKYELMQNMGPPSLTVKILGHFEVWPSTPESDAQDLDLLP